MNLFFFFNLIKYSNLQVKLKQHSIVSRIIKTLKICLLTKIHEFNVKNATNTAGYIICMYFIKKVNDKYLKITQAL